MRPTEKSRLHSWPEKKADFVEPMECELVTKLREGSEWVYEVKLDGYRGIAVKSGNKVSLFSRRRKSFNQQYPHIVEALSDLPNGTVIDGEIVALDDSGRPEFNLLQNYRSEAHRIRYFIFDLLCYENRDTTCLPLVDRRALLRTGASLLPSFPQTLEGEGYCANLRQRMVLRYRRASTFGTAANALDGSATPQFSMMRSDSHCHTNDVTARLSGL